LVIVLPALSLAALLLFFLEIRRAARGLGEALRESTVAPATVGQAGG